MIFGHDSLLSRAPVGIALVAGTGVLVSMACALVAFANRNYLPAPEPGVVVRLAGAPDDWIGWRLIGNVLDALEKNRAKLRQKSRWLTSGQFALLVALAPLGAYLVSTRLGGDG